jgi:hypothetical protein
MKLHKEKHRPAVTQSDLSASMFNDVNLSGLRIDHGNPAGASIVNCRLEGMPINGVEAAKRSEAWKRFGEAAT